MMRKVVMCAFLMFGLMNVPVSAYVVFLGADGVDTSYTASSGLLEVSEIDIVITIANDDGSQSAIVDGSFDMTSNFDSGMHFAGGDFEFADDTATAIILGDIIEINFIEFNGLLLGSGVAEILVENLPEEYTIPSPAEAIMVFFDITPAFTDFNSDFSGESEINFLLSEPVPEPATICLLSFGGFLLRRKRKS